MSDRERYRKAAEMSRTRGKFTCLLINDLDAGIGHFKDTQVTVNNQVSAAALLLNTAMQRLANR